MSGTETAFPPAGLTTIQTIIPSYLYQQYTDDDYLQTFVLAYNTMAQWYIDWFNTANLPVWSKQFGQLLDWVAAGLYGMVRPVLSYTTGIDLAGYNTAPYNTVAYDAPLTLSVAQYVPVTDDIFQRIMTWHLYKGDGWQYSTRWLKQRIHRFLNGANGYLPVNDNTDDVSVTYSGTNVTITLTNSNIAQVFQYALSDGFLALPFQLAFTVTLV